MKLSQALVYKVRAALSEKGLSLHKVCLANEIHTGNIYAALRGELNSEQAIKDRTVVIKAAFSDSQIKRMKLDEYLTDLNQTSVADVSSDSPVCCA